MLPIIVAIPYGNLQCLEPFKYVDDTNDYGGVSDGVVVEVPVDFLFCDPCWASKVEQKPVFSEKGPQSGRGRGAHGNNVVLGSVIVGAYALAEDEGRGSEELQLVVGGGGRRG
ncbi:hypothetical protein LR48_Vigan05g094300 [Vigna angularis]|uniref:Uncharacterized protein n=1 Tax=Phaseolus angularis TaxID=3914 RepID=A0A0L9ULA2_PHAAN|nr:hypothetical protein LR48_Vigan05g094300 [Vigna angularis]